MNGERSLRRFVDAQDAGAAYHSAITELRAGQKTSHWMWFVFPQIAGLGHSEMARHYAISSIEEARAYASDPTLGSRLRECALALLETEDRTAQQVLGETDAMKLRSSMTLFSRAAPDEPLFSLVLDRYFNGEVDETTLRLLRST